LKSDLLTATSQLIKQLPAKIAYVDTKCQTIHLSNSLAEYLDINHHVAIGKPFFELCKKNHQRWKKTVNKALQGHNTVSENSLDTSEISIASKPWYDGEENIIGAIIELQNPNTVAALSTKIKQLESILKHQSEISNVGTWIYDIENSTINWSETTKKIHEVDDTFMPNLETALDFYEHGLHRNTIAMLVHNCELKGEAWKVRSKIITNKGNEKWVTSAGRPILENGKIVQLVGTFQDITKEVMAEMATKESEQLLRTLIDNVPLNIYIKNKNFQKTLVNRAEADYVGVTDVNDLIGKTDHDLYPKETADLSRIEDIQILETKKPILSKRTISIKNNGEKTNFLTSKIPWLDSYGDCRGIIGISLDTTEMVKKEDELKDLINVTSLQNKKLINFAHIVSHNLRSHTANFAMLLDFLVKEKSNEEKNRILEMLTKASDNLLDTLENLNEVVDISTNLNLEKKKVNVYSTVIKVTDSLSGFLKKHDTTFINNIPQDLVLETAPVYLESIILNLITNAVKYRHPDRQPEIILAAKVKGDSFVLSTSDNGLGIDLKKYGSKLFGMYKTFHKNKDARGIGLYLVKNQVQAMGGSIKVTSEVDKGSTFNLILPYGA